MPGCPRCGSGPPGIDDRAAVLLESLVRSHDLVDGNKRIGWLATVVVYGLNGITLEAPDDDAYDLVIALASGGRVRNCWAAGSSRNVTGSVPDRLNVRMFNAG